MVIVRLIVCVKVRFPFIFPQARETAVNFTTSAKLLVVTFDVTQSPLVDHMGVNLNLDGTLSKSRLQT